MHTINLQIDESFYPHFKAIIDSFVNDNKIKILQKREKFPRELVINSIEEVQRRVYASEQEKSLSQEEYDIDMDIFFEREFGVKR
ncbi:hypothetical protein GSY74_08655 [Sulfurovum sp. bin170]|uniref:hypothetical protein n=1 Tax=Sulfurovum sp. bin170 TaxID=2695268 RepID=UPI0013DE7C86|nr:hypothetical protein [Sulfurovum sp. bin170]NEW61350.1 hypothetical protein [Sulfurovum sp. bin170]